jgi:hypothetical protein
MLLLSKIPVSLIVCLFVVCYWLAPAVVHVCGTYFTCSITLTSEEISMGEEELNNVFSQLLNDLGIPQDKQLFMMQLPPQKKWQLITQQKNKEKQVRKVKSSVLKLIVSTDRQGQ